VFCVRLGVLPGITCVILLLISVGSSPHLLAVSETLTVEPAGEAYNFVTHYRIQVAAPAAEVWAALIDFDAWMYEFEQSTVTGEAGTPGHVIRLYEGQDFLTQITAVVPQQMLSVVNLPLTFRGEFGTGVGIFTLHELGEVTEVSLTMSRRYSPAGEGFNEMRTTRESADFQERTRAMWQDRFLVRLKSIAEKR